MLPPADLSVPPSQHDEPLRLAKLREGLSEAFHLHPDAMKYVQVLSDELPEVRRAWGEARRALARARDEGVDENAAEDATHRFFSLSFALLNDLPTTKEHELDRRAVCEATAEMVPDPSRRQRMLAELARGASRAGDLGSARQWLAHMDPRSADLAADSAFRLAAATLATAEARWDEVLTLLGAEAGQVPIGSSYLVVSALMRANALEKLGRMPQARAELVAAVRQRKSALGTLESIARRTAEWTLCERSLPEVRERVLPKLAAHLRAPFAAILVGLVLGLGTAVAAALHGEWTVAAIGAAVALASLAAWVRDARRLRRIVRGALLVEGRVHRIEPLGGSRGRFHVELEPADGSAKVDAVIDANIPPLLTAETIVGRPFDGYWNPSLPNAFVYVVFQVLPPSRAAPGRPASR